MSQLIKTETKSPTLPKMQGKLFAAFKIEPFVHSLVFGKGLNPAETIRPSDIGMNSHAARSSLGGTVSVPGFITGLCWSLCALAHGQKKLSALQEGLPPASQFALAHGASHFKPGAGITAGSLETIALASLKAMLALPAPAKAKVATEDQTVVAAKAESLAKAEAERRAAEACAAEQVSIVKLTMQEVLAGILSMGSSLDNEASPQQYQIMRLETARALRIAEESARENAEQEYKYRQEGKTLVAKIHAFCGLATELGVKLTPAQLKILDALEYPTKVA
jgi:hypothetical protein